MAAKNWGVALSLVAVVLSGCATSYPAVVPEQVYAEVAASDRERNYDLAWQDIARLNGAIERGDYAVVADNALLAVARIARLESGRPERLDDRSTAAILEQSRAQWVDSDQQTVQIALRDKGVALRSLFDAGDFEPALALALEVLVLSDEALNEQPS